MYKPKFNFDDVVEVESTSSREKYGGSFEVDDLLRLVRYDPEDNTWRYRYEDGRKGTDEFWISQDDLRKRKSTEQLDAEARQLFGVDPLTHCPTCQRAF